MKSRFLPELPGKGRLAAYLPGSPAGRGVRPPRLPAARRHPHSGRLALNELRGNLAITATTVTAWYTCEEHVWPFQPDARRVALIGNTAAQYAALAGRAVHVRRTSVPFDIDRWARTLDANSRPLPDDPANPDISWAAHLTNIKNRLDGAGYAISRTQIGVTFNTRVRPGVDLPEALLRQIDETTEDLAGPGLEARPSTASEMTWLIYRSIGIGLTPPEHQPGDVGIDDIAEFSEAADWDRGPYDNITRITDRRTGRTVHVTVLTVGRMETLNIPQEHQPWAHLSDQFPFPVEWSSRFDILGPEQASGPLHQRARVLRAQREEYAEHRSAAPPELARVVDRATEIGDEIDTGRPEIASRAYGWHRMAVFGDTADECLARAREVIRTYGQQLRTTLTIARGQLGQLREFTPGEPVADTGYLRRLPVMMVAAAVPQATSEVGDDRGDLIGTTATSGERPVFWDPHFPMEVRERSGMAVLVAEPGGGKSTLMGALGYLNARRGVQVTLMDPSGPLARLCELPELAPHSRVIDLTGSQPGTLAPYALIPTPCRDDFPDTAKGEIDFSNAVETSQAERQLLVADICQMLLPPQVVADRDMFVALSAALRAVPPTESRSLNDVVTMLYDQNDPGSAAHVVASLLEDRARLPMGRLFFGWPPKNTLSSDAALTVITMGGIRLPEFGTDRSFWSLEETLAVPALHLANRLAVRRAYSGDRHARKLVGLDELHIMLGWESGRVFVDRLARDSRKWNIGALGASQNPKDILRLDVQNLVSTVLVGRIAANPAIAAGALELLGVPTGAGYEDTLAALSQQSSNTNLRLGYREFVMRDVDGRVQKIRADLSHLPGLLDALDTTPGGIR